MMNNRLYSYLVLMRFDKPIGALLLLWPTLWALWLTGEVNFHLFWIFVIGVLLMRAAGCVMNDFADRHYDGHVERTKFRPLATGEISPNQALVVFAILIFLSGLLLLTLNALSWLVACFSVFVTILYPFMKRFINLPQLVLGIAFSCGIPMAYAATVESFPLNCWLLFLANLCWIVAYDTQYAMVDRQDDLKVGIKSTAILFGRYDKLMVMLLQIITITLFVIIGLINHFSNYFYTSLMMASLLFLYQQYLIKDRQREQCFKAFLNNNLVGLMILIGIVL